MTRTGNAERQTIPRCASSGAHQEESTEHQFAPDDASLYAGSIGKPRRCTMNRKITRQDVVEAAAAKGIRILEALNMMQAAAAKMGDESTLEQLCAIKSDMLFGDE